jgi:hypothetical protein
VAWHEHHVTSHLNHLVEVRDKGGDAGERLRAVLEGYAFISYETSHRTTAPTWWHSCMEATNVARAQHQLNHLLRDLLAAAAKSGHVRGVVAPDELASATASTLSPATCHPRPPSAGSSPSPWPGCGLTHDLLAIGPP